MLQGKGGLEQARKTCSSFGMPDNSLDRANEENVISLVVLFIFLFIKAEKG